MHNLSGGSQDYESIYTVEGISDFFFREKRKLSQQDFSTVAAPRRRTDGNDCNESNETFIDRRNRFLDHLDGASFAESFNEYAFLMYTLDEATQVEVHKLTRLI